MKKWPLAFVLVLALAGVRIFWTKSHSHDQPEPPSPSEEPGELSYTLADLHAVDPLTRMQSARWMAMAPAGEAGRPAAAELVPALIERLHLEHNEQVRSSVSWALSQIGTATVPLLMAELRQEGRLALQEAMVSFGMIFPGSAAFALQLAEDNYQSQQFVVAVGSALGQMKQEVLPLLVQALKEPEGGFVLAGAAIGLAWMGPRASEAVPALVKLLPTEDELIAGPICQALGQIGRPAIGPLRQALKDPNPRTRANAALALDVVVRGGRFDPTLGPLSAGGLEQERLAAKKEALPELQAALNDTDPRVRLFAARALLDQGRAEQDMATPILRELTGNSDAFVRMTATESLRALEAGRRDAGIR